MSQNEDNYYEEQEDRPGELHPIQDAPKKMGDHTDPNAHIKYGRVINVPLCSTSDRKVTELKECYLALYDTFMIYKVLAKCDKLVHNEEVATDEWLPMKINYRFTRTRKDILDVSMDYDNRHKLYFVQMTWVGNIEYNWYYERGQDAKLLHDLLQNYFVTRPDMVVYPDPPAPQHTS
jgi:hypothetical protein